MCVGGGGGCGEELRKNLWSGANTLAQCSKSLARWESLGLFVRGGGVSALS